MRRPSLVAGLALALGTSTALAGISAEQAAQLGQNLTPTGAEKAGNTDGSIPAWTGGIQQAPAGYQPGGRYLDPFAADQPLLTITKANMASHAAMLSEGHKQMLRQYPNFKLPIYPSRRSASLPQAVYDATRNNALTAKLDASGDQLSGALLGFPFPVPGRAEEVIWNHKVRYTSQGIVRTNAQVPVLENGSYTVVSLHEEIAPNYARIGVKPGDLNNILFYFIQEIRNPPRLAGRILLVHEPMDQVAQPRDAWAYNSGQRRVRRAPNVSYDNPGTGSDGLRTNDQFDQFNGALDRYNWTLKGKKEMYIPYNAYKLHSDQYKYSDILQPGHMNADLGRYEKHRVWIVEANLKDSFRHLYKRRTFYVDEDSWQITMVDCYDNAGNLWRFQEGHALNIYSVPFTATAADATYDLQNGRYIVLNLSNEESVPKFDQNLPLNRFTPSAIRKRGVR